MGVLAESQINRVQGFSVGPGQSWWSGGRTGRTRQGGAWWCRAASSAAYAVNSLLHPARRNQRPVYLKGKGGCVSVPMCAMHGGPETNAVAWWACGETAGFKQQATTQWSPGFLLAGGL